MGTTIMSQVKVRVCEIDNWWKWKGKM